MKKAFFLLIVFVTIAGIFFSCKKEKSCEGCNSISNKPPAAIAGPDQVITLPTDSILLDGTASSDRDGTISEWLWTKISGPATFNIPNSVVAKSVAKNLVAGIYQFELKVKDNGGLFAKDTMQVIVDAVITMNHPPVANAGTDQVITLPVNTVTIDGSASTDPDNNISAYLWTKISGPSSLAIANADAVQTQVNNLVQGTYLFELKVTDAGGLFSKDTMQVTVNNTSQPNRPPIANAGTDQTIILPINNVNANGGGSSDPDNNIVAYVWTKISGPAIFTIANANSMQTTITNLVMGVYQFELKVTDAGGLFSRDTMQVTVINLPPACTNCRIVFVSDRDGNDEIYSCKVDGSDIQRLTNHPWRDDEPAWSPDGTKIAFISSRSGNQELYIMNSDGSNLVRKTFANFASDPSWSPDGTKIVYTGVSNGSTNIWVVNATSGSPVLLFNAPGLEIHPAWSPDGTKIALVSDWMAYDFVYDIYTINANGTGFTPLTGNIFDHIDYLNPNWSPSGTKFAMAISETIGIDQYNTQVGVMNTDGSGLIAIISGAAAWTRTSWSSDGTKIAYTSLFGSRKDISWVSIDGSVWGTIVTNGWDADWQH